MEKIQNKMKISRMRRFEQVKRTDERCASGDSVALLGSQGSKH